MIGLQPRSLSWVLPHRLAVSERPGGSGMTHRRIRREEEICWLVKQGFSVVVSLLPGTNNLQAYDDAGLRVVHLAVTPTETLERLDEILSTLDQLVRVEERKVLLHADDVDDQVAGICGAYLLHLGLVPNAPSAVATIERLTSRALEPYGRSIVQGVAAKPAR
jgi:hypothetical protein